MSARVLLTAALALAVPAPLLAQPPAPLDPEPTTPYLWRVVIQARPHPLVTPAFRDQLRRDLLAALQPGLGPLGTVEVVDLAEVPREKWDPLWQQFDDKGFAALDAPRDLTGVKTHFLRVEVRDGVFHLEARQHDGFAGLASPVVRRQSARAAELVGRTAGLMVDRDFGLAGTVEPIEGKTDDVRVRFRGGKLGPLDRFVKPGDVFAVSRITRTTRPAPPPARTATGRVIAPPPGSVPPPALSPAVREFTLLKVAEEPRDGAARCTVLTQYKVGLPTGAGIVGYRCLRLATVEAPVGVRLTGGDEKGSGAGSVQIQVVASDAGFGGPKPDPRDYLDLRDGLYRSPRPLANVACVSVYVGPTEAKRFPVPVLGPDPVTLPFVLDPKDEERAAFNRAVIAVSSRAADARAAEAACFETVARLINDRKNPEALARARAGYEAAVAADRALGEELQRLRGQLDKSPGAANRLTAVEQQLSALRELNGQLGARVKDLEAVVAKENDPGRAAREVQAEALVARISLLLSQGEVDEALGAYDQLATLLPGNADVKARREKLAAEWKPKGDEHARAREYLLKTWPALATVPDLVDSLPQLRNAVEVCKKAGDKYAVRKFLTRLGGFPATLTDLVKDLDPNADADRKTLADAQTVREFVGKLDQELQEFLKANP